MNSFVRFSSLVAALCLGLPATGLSHDRHANLCDWHGHFRGPGVRFCPPHFAFYGALPFFYGAPYYGPSVSFSYTPDPGPTYRGERADDHPGDLTTDVQRALGHEGYYHGDIDGDIGPGTRAAIRQYQYDHHLEVTGRIDRSLLRSLGIE
jgi:hypothetical protein